MKIVASTILAGVLLTSCGGYTPDTAPADTDITSLDTKRAMFALVWEEQSPKSQAAMCLLPDVSAQAFYDSMSKGGNPSDMTLADAQTLFAEVC